MDESFVNARSIETTDGHGLLRVKPTVDLPSKVHNVVSQLVSSESRSLSVSIRVHSWLTLFSTAWFRPAREQNGAGFVTDASSQPAIPPLQSSQGFGLRSDP
jgi:hypothetical protein